jgi:hypothetical protein
MAFSRAWGQQLQSFNSLHDVEDRLPLSPSPSDIVTQHGTMRHGNIPQVNLSGGGPPGHRAIETSNEVMTNYDSNLLHETPTAQTAARLRYLSHANSSALTTPSPSPATDILHSTHSPELQSIPTWHVDTLGAPAIPFTTEIHGQGAQSWWPPILSLPHVSLAPSQPLFPSVDFSPFPQKQVQSIPHPNDLFQGGLMIQFDPSLDISPVPVSTLTLSSSSSTVGQDKQFYSPPSAAQQGLARSSTYIRPSGFHATHSSRSPSISPTLTASKTCNTACSGRIAKGNQRRPLSRKLCSQSTNGVKPTNKPFGSTMAKGANKAMNVSFVNFTPKDGQRILTGVAPSGSSKTKARREQEAREKRRKLSEAALMAVKQAGGNVEALEAMFC